MKTITFAAKGVQISSLWNGEVYDILECILM